MRRWSVATSVLVAGLLLFAGRSAAQGADSERIRQLEQQLRQMQQELKGLQEKQSASQEAIEKRDELLIPLAKSLKDVKLGVNVAVRYAVFENEDEADLILDEGGQVRGFRLRTRFGVRYEPDGPIQAGFRLTTGGQNPTVPFIPLGNAFRERSFGIDQAYIAIHGAKFFDDRPLHELPFNASLFLGKIENPFWLGNWDGWTSEMTWDKDVHPEGIALRLSAPKLTPFLGIESNTAYFIIEEIQDNRFIGLTGDTYMVGSQLKVDIKPPGPISLSLAGTYYAYENLNAGLRFPSLGGVGGGFDLNPGTTAFLLRPENGLQRTNNTVNFGLGANGFLEDHFDVINLTGQVHFAIPGMPALSPHIYLVGDYLNNIGVDEDQIGYSGTIGVRMGKLGGVINPIQAWFTYRDVDDDATLSTFAHSDLGAGTGYRGWEIGTNYRVHRNLLVAVYYSSFDGFPDKDTETQRFYFDVIANF